METKKKSRKLNWVLVIVLIVVILECCFASSKLPDDEAASNDTVLTTEEGTIVEEDVVAATETEDTEESTEAANFTTPKTQNDLYTAHLGESYICEEYDGYALYANIFYDNEDSLRFVGWAEDNSGNKVSDMYRNITMHRVDDSTWADEDNNYVINNLFDKESYFIFFNQNNYDDPFSGTFSFLVDPNATSEYSESESMAVLSYEEFDAFVRNQSNIGKSVSFTGVIYGDTNGIWLIVAYEPTCTKGTIEIMGDKCETDEMILPGDQVVVTGVYNGFNNIGRVDMTFTSVARQ